MSSLHDHYQGGAGDPLLLIHGFTATWRVWGPVPEMLSDSHHVLAPTLPGHSGGPPLDGVPTIERLSDALEETLDDHNWGSVHIAGFSLGGWLALELAKRGRARSVIALCPGGAHTSTGDRETNRIARVFRRGRRAARAGLPFIDRLCRSPRFRRIAFRDMMVNGDRLDPLEAASMIRAFAQTPLFDELLHAMGASGGLRDLHRVDVPVHLVWGERDRVLPIRHSPFFSEAIRHATFHAIPDAGHVPFWDAPHEIAEQIRTGVAVAKGAVARPDPVQ